MTARLQLSSRCRPALVVAAAMFVLAGSAWAQTGLQRIEADPQEAPTYVLRALDAWGEAQEAAVVAAGGTVTYRHPGARVGIATASDASFLDLVTASGAFTGVAADRHVVWDRVTPSAELGEHAIAAVVPGNETFINAMWNLTAIDAFGAWGLGYDGEGVRVAVVDGGICATHQDLDANIDLARSRSFVPGAGFGDDAPGFRSACHVAGVIAAEDNDRGTIGVAPRATIIAVKALHNGTGTFERILQAILYAADPIAEGGAGADIVVVSPSIRITVGGDGGAGGDLISAVNDAVNYATSRGVLVVCAAGDDAEDLQHAGNVRYLPAEAGNGITIAATGPLGFAVGYPNGATDFDRPATYTNYGSSAIWMAAPGGDNALDHPGACPVPRMPAGTISFPCFVYDQVGAPGFVSGSNHVYSWVVGTRVAAAHVAGVAALVKQKDPGISVGALKTTLKNAATRPGHWSGNETTSDPYLGHGFLNAFNAVSDGAASTIERVSGDLGVRGPAPALELAVSPVPLRGRDATFAFSTPGAGHARLELFDLAGRSVAVLFDGFAAAGRTTVAWSGRGRGGAALAHGAYFARLSAGGAHTARTLVLVGE